MSQQLIRREIILLMCDRFDTTISLALDICNKIESLANSSYNNDSDFDQTLVEACHMFSNRNIPCSITVFIQERMSSQSITLQTYALILYGIYLRYIQNTEYCTQIVVAARHTLFTRLILDLDVTMPDIFNYTESIARIMALLKSNHSYTITRRQNMNSQNFHLVVDKQFDSMSMLNLQRFIAKKIPNNIGFKIDVVEAMFLPTGRFHRVENQYKHDTMLPPLSQPPPSSSSPRTAAMTFEDFKMISPIDLWNENNLYTIMRIDLGHNLNNDDDDIGMNYLKCELKTPDQSFEHQYIMNETQFEIVPFFRLFDKSEKIEFYDNQHSILATFTRANFNEYLNKKKSDTGGRHLAHNEFDDEDELRRMADMQRVSGDEFCEIFFHTTIEHTKHPRDISQIDTSLTKNNMAELMRDNMPCYIAIQRNANATSNYGEYLKFIKEHYVNENLSVDEATYITNSKHLNPDPFISVFCSNLHEVEYGAFLHAFLFFYVTDFKHQVGVSERLKVALFKKMSEKYMISIKDDIANIAPNYQQIHEEFQPGFDFYHLFKDEIHAIMKKFLVYMLNRGHIADTLALLVRYISFENIPILSATCLCLSFNANNMLEDHVVHKLRWFLLCEHQQYVSYISLKNIFMVNPMIYIVSNMFYAEVGLLMKVFQSRIEKVFNILEPAGGSEAAGPPSKRKKQSVPEQFERFNDLISIRYLACYLRNADFGCVYSNEEYKDFTYEKTDVRLQRYATQMDIEPKVYNFWYRRDLGVYCSVSQIFDHCSPGLTSFIHIKFPLGAMDNANKFLTHFPSDWTLKNFIFSLFLKARHFIDFCHDNKTMAIFLNTIEPPSKSTLPHHFIQITPFDFKQINFQQFHQTQSTIANYPHLYRIFKLVYVLVCSISNRCDIDYDNPVEFIVLSNKVLLNSNNNKPNSSSAQQQQQEQQNLNLSTVSSDNHPTASNQYTTMRLQKFLSSIQSYLINVFNQPVFSNQIASIQLLSTTINTKKIYRKIDEFILFEYLNGEVLNVDLITLPHLENKFYKFIFCITTWFVRCDIRHTSLKFFHHFQTNQTDAYHELVDICENICGKFMLHQDLQHLARYFQRFCSQTTLHVHDDFGLTHKQYQIINNNALHEEELSDFHKSNLFQGMAGLILYSQFCSDTLFDLIKYMCECTHRGNNTRVALAMLRRTGTGKNHLVEMMMNNFRNTDQTFQNAHMQNDETLAGNEFSKPLSRNLLISVDEYARFTSSFKILVSDSSVLTQRKYHAQGKAQYRVNAHIIIATNDYPTGATAATISRCAPIDRLMQFEELISSDISRANNFVETVVGTTSVNNKLASQLILQKLPGGGVVNTEALGVFLITWNMADLFFYSLTQPSSLKRSPTMLKLQQDLIYTVQPAKYLLDNKIITASPEISMTESDFNAAILAKLRVLKPMWSSEITIDSILRDLKDRLSNYILENKYYVSIN